MDGAMEIMKLVLTGKDYLWGGTRLREEYGKKLIYFRWQRHGNALFILMDRATLRTVSLRDWH